MADQMTDEDDNFSMTQPTIIRQLQSILGQYPDDGQILKELIQNAEDARAKRVCFIYDDTQHGTDQLAHPELGLHQGPALYAFNDAVFEKDDWTGVGMLLDSIKSKDPMKVGKFGLGFKSVFHMTDLPSIMSGEYLAFLDPHEKYFNKSNGYRKTASRYKLNSYKSTLAHQFEPYQGIFGCDENTFVNGEYNGTIFRFPLRQQESPLSDTLYTPQKVSNLFTSFKRDAHLVLLFLKHVESVELCMRKKGGPVQTLFKVQIKESCQEEVRSKRQDFQSKFKPNVWLDEAAEVIYPLLVETLNYKDGNLLQKKEYTWMISEYLAGGELVSDKCRALSLDEKLCKMPLVGVAYQLDFSWTKGKRTTGEPISDSMAKKRKTDFGSEMNEGQDELGPEGQVFCFLPMPVEERSSTGLPVLVNGYFSISQDRHHLKWPSQGQNIENDKDILWNQCLLEELVPKAYGNLILKLVQFCKEGRSDVTPMRTMFALPDKAQVDNHERWRVVLEPFYTQILQHKLFYSPVDGGCWVPSTECVLDMLEEPSETCSVLRKVLSTAGIKVVNLPPHVIQAISVYCAQRLQSITPEFTRNQCLKLHPDAYTGLPRDEKLLLLAYILKDEGFCDLEGIHLLPTADNSFTKFTASTSALVYVPTSEHPRKVLCGLDDMLIADGLPDAVMLKINRIASEGHMQIQLLDKVKVLGLINRAIPKTWYQERPVTIKDTAKLEWLENLWNYLRIQTPENLEMLSGLPLLVLKQNEDDEQYVVEPLSLPSVMVLDKMPGRNLSRKVCKSLQVLGVKVISEVPLFIQNHTAILGKYVRLPLPKEVMDCVVQAAQTDGLRLVEGIKEKTTVEEKKALCVFLGKSDVQNLKAKHIKVLSMLPLFGTVPHGKQMTSDFVSVNEVHKAAPESVPISSINTKLLDLKNEDIKRLALKLNVRILQPAEFLVDIIFPELVTNVANGRSEQTVDYIMGNFLQLQQEKSDFVACLQRVPFLQSGGGKYLTVKECFDPESKTLEDLFLYENKFPVGKYAGSHFLPFLRQLGLKQVKDVSAEDVWTSALKIESLKESLGHPLKNARKKSAALVKHLCENTTLLLGSVNGKQLKEKLMQIQWMACLTAPPGSFPAELGLCEEHSFLEPWRLLPLEAAPLVGCVAPVSESRDAQPVLEAFGVPLLPTVSQALMQVKKIYEVYQPKEKAKYLQIVTSVYAYLRTKDCTEVAKALQDINFKDWVWQGEGFTKLESVLSSQIDLKPYLFSLPDELRMFETMFRDLGMCEKCSPRTLVSVLQEIKSVHSSVVQDADVRARDLQFAVSILNRLKDEQNELDDDDRVRIVMPVVSPGEVGLSLLAIDECTYCDVDWLQLGNPEGINLLHPDVPLKTAKALKVPAMRRRMLNAEELSLTGFGQYESLTNRLRSLLDDYTDGCSVAKELVQNADDAGATVVKLLYDERSNNDKMQTLLDEGMKECQGPAFWAYNDAMFSEKDIENITKLGGATKEKDIHKIGKFGLGFNAVYNMTDVPSFVSGNYLVIFDPHTTHLGDCIKDRARPGVKINLFENKESIKQLPDQFHPYQNLFGCSIDPAEQKEYQGTLFRFPLRTAQQAVTSEISNYPYNDREMIKLLSMFVKGAESMLLFTQNVKRIELHHIPPTGGEPALLYTVNKEKVKTVTPLSINPEVHFDVLKTCCRQFANLESCQASMKTSMVVEVNSSITEHGRSFFENGMKTGRNMWMLSYVVDMSQNVATLKRQLEKGYCPYGAAAVPVNQLGHDLVPGSLESIDTEGTLYCHLPLPILSGLPVHINGSFAVQSNRRHLCEKTDDDKNSWKADWNESLLQKAVCQAYRLLLQDLPRLNQSARVDYIALWPDLHSIFGTLKPLVESFYDNFQDLVMVCNEQGPVTLSQAVIFDKSLLSNHEHSALATDAFIQAGVKRSIVNIHDKIRDTLWTVNRSAIEPHLLDEKRFFCEVFFPHISRIDGDLRDKVLVWAFQVQDDNILNIMKQTPCLPASPDGSILKKPSELIHPSSQALKLFHPSEGRFVHSEILRKTEFANVLQELGIKMDYLDWGSIIDRGHSIKKLVREDHVKTSKQTPLERAKMLLEYIGAKLEQEKSNQKCEDLEQVASCLREMTILPAASPPYDSPLKWKNGNLKENPLVSADEAYLSSQAPLLSSVCPIADKYSISFNVQKLLGLLEKVINPEDVLQQLKFVSNLNPALLQNVQMGKFQKLQAICLKIYSYLNDKCKKDTQKDVQQVIYDKFCNEACILVQDRFLQPRELAWNKCDAVPPFLYAVPSDYVSLKPLLNVLGVREHFEPTDYISHVTNLKEKFRGEPLEKKELRSCVELLSGLSSSMIRNGMSFQDVQDAIGTIYVPNVSRILMASSELCYNNCPWMQISLPKNMLNARVVYEVAATVGVKTQTREILDEHALGFPFGQSERLTTSLKRIVENYPLNQEVLKELVQNADDATATKIHFVLDWRKLGTERIFEDSWKPLQGPALCVFNNKPFTTSDLESIQRVGESSKVNDPCKTGKYGVGFNSVYHITDAPAVLTANDEHGDMLCVFDPHCNYIPGATTMNPGRLFKDLDSLRMQFPDVFAGYLEQHADLQNGTMFRFPLRTEEMAVKSEISQKVVSPGMMNQMLQEFKDSAPEMLLFSNYLEELKLSGVYGDPGNLSSSYTVYATLSDEDKAKREAFHKKCLKTGMQLKSGQIAIEDVEQEKVEYTLQLKNGTNRQTWRIIQVLGFLSKEDVPDDVKAAYRQGKLALLPRGGVAFLLENYVNERRTHGRIRGKAFCCLPMPLETGLPVHINGHFSLSFENRQQIWSPTGADAELKQGWNHLLCKQVIGTAYVDLLISIRGHGLLTSSSPSSVVQEYQCSEFSLSHALSIYQDCFPQLNSVCDDWNSLIKAVYTLMASTGAPLFPCVLESGALYRTRCGHDRPSCFVEWFPLHGKENKTAFLTSADDNNTDHEHQVDIKVILARCGVSILRVKLHILDNIKKSGVKVDCLSPDCVLAFFQSYSSATPACDLGAPLPSPIGETSIKDVSSLMEILRYCSLSEDSIGSFEGMPLLLTNDEVLRVFDSLAPVYVTQYSCLFKRCGDLFLHNRLQQEFFEKQQLGQGRFSLTNFTVNAVGQCLRRTLSSHYFVNDALPWKTWKKYEHEMVSESWVKALWTFLSSECKAKGMCQSHEIKQFVIEPLKDCCLLPVKKGESNEYVLYKVGRVQEVVNTEKIPSNFWTQEDVVIPSYFRKLEDVVTKLHVPQLDECALDQVSLKYLKSCSADFEQPNLILSAFYKVYTENKAVVPLGSLASQQCLEYFAKYTYHLQKCNATIKQLRALPFYETICSDVISLTDCILYVLPPGMLTMEMDVWQRKSETVFLKKKEALQSLYDFIGAKSLSVVEVYCDFILQHFEYLSKKARMVHLMHAFDTYLDDQAVEKLTKQDKECLLSSLRYLNVIEDTHGNMHPASYYYDPEIKVFRAMIEADRFPPEAIGFRQTKWLLLLRVIGLTCTVTSEMCVQFAKQIAQEALNTPSKRTESRSKTLVKYLLSSKMPDRDTILKQVTHTRFICAQRVPEDLLNLHPQYGNIDDGRLAYISFEGSYTEIHTELIWTCAGILPNWADPFSRQDGKLLAGLLRVEETPPIDLVAHNFKKVCSEVTECDHVDDEALKRCCMKTYRFLQDMGMEDGKLKPALEGTLNDISCIAVGGRVLVKPCQTTLNILEPDEIKPYLYKIPYEYGEFKSLFIALGASESPIFDQYAQVLDVMHREIGEEQLTPNEILLVLKSMKGLFDSLNKNKAREALKTGSLSLLSDNRCLYDATKVIFNDAPWLHDRVGSYNLRFLVDLKECGLKGNLKEFLDLLPDSCKPVFLSEHVKEVLVNESRDQLVSTGLAGTLGKRLGQEAFHSAISRLAHHQAHKTGNKVSDETLQIAFDNLSNTAVFAAERIVTHLIYKEKHVKGSRMEKKCFYQKILNPNGNNFYEIYVKNGEGMSEDLLTPLVEVLNAIMDGILKDSVIYLLHILRCDEADIGNRLDELNVHSDVTRLPARPPTLPRPGSVVNEGQQHMLHDARATLLKNGDFVAVKEEDDTYVYGIVQKVISSDLCRIDTGQQDECIVSIRSSLKSFARPHRN